MKLYHLSRTQFLPIPLSEAWEFFSTPGNLSRITPRHMGFEILYSSGSGKTYAGQIIRYKVSVLPWLRLHWVTEITHVKEPFYFVDEQRFGPYAFWHHQHIFREVPGGVEMTDELNYALPLGILGQLAHRIFVRGEVTRIFDYRFQVLEKFFTNKKAPQAKTIK